jgi:hypothetical protein
MLPNSAFEGSAKERRSLVPVALRAPAPPQRDRWALSIYALQRENGVCLTQFG